MKTNKTWEVVRIRPDGTESRNSFGRGAEEEGDAWELYSRLTMFAGTVTISKNGKIVDEQTKTYSL